ncbi:MAG: hypothetical protein DRG27_03890 [Deltaproteobacteria bacterium]|nr:MAG: hypothetical protein DRG27_03890 [Deltaproteobacteria bacterium]
MALINQNELFDRLKTYIDRKVNLLGVQLDRMFKDYGMDIIVENMDSIVLVGDNIDYVKIVGNEMMNVITVAGMEAYIRDIANEPLRSAIIDAEGNADKSELKMWDAMANAFTSRSYAVATTDVREYSSNDDGTFDYVQTDEQSAKTKVELIQAISVTEPVTSVPPLPNNDPGIPDVVYDPATNSFAFSIPVGSVGSGIHPLGHATVAEVNAMVDDDNNDGVSWIMLDAGTITSGTTDVDVIIDEWIVWSDANQAWANIGIMHGPKGDIGLTGAGGTTAAGVTTTLAPAESATVTEAVGSTPEATIWDFGIPRGEQGEPAQVVIPTGSATVAEINAFVVDPPIGSGYWMTDSGTITYGDPDVDVVTNEVIVWVADGYFVNMGIMVMGTSWSDVTNVTVNGLAPAIDDDLSRVGTSYTKAEQDAIDLIQDDAITLNTAKVGITTEESAAIVANTAKVTGSDRVLTTEGVTSVAAGDADRITNMVSLTQAEYDLLTPVATTLYVIVVG